MATYFPYSAIIDLYRSVKQTISKPAFTSEWGIAEPSHSSATKVAFSDISELYY